MLCLVFSLCECPYHMGGNSQDVARAGNSVCLLYMPELLPFTVQDRSVCQARPRQSTSVPSPGCQLTCRRMFGQAGKLKRYRCWLGNSARGIVGCTSRAEDRPLCSSFCSSDRRCNTCKSWSLRVNKTFLLTAGSAYLKQLSWLLSHAMAMLFFSDLVPGFGQQTTFFFLISKWLWR